MLKKILNLIYLNFKGYSLMRAFQIIECKNISLKGKSIEFGAYKNHKKNFSNFFKGKSSFKYSNVYNDNKDNYIKLDLTKKLKLGSNRFHNVIIFNVLEHVHEINIPFNEIKRILKSKGLLIGSTPFLYQVHGAPNDYFRFTKEFYHKKLSKKFKNIKVIPLGYGPFVSCFGLINSYLRFLPFIKEMILIISIILDFIIQIFVKTNLKEIYPIGFFFIIRK